MTNISTMQRENCQTIVMRQCGDELYAIKSVVIIIIVHLEVVKLQLLLRHFLLRLLYLPVEVLHYVPYIQKKMMTHYSHYAIFMKFTKKDIQTSMKFNDI